MTGLLLGLCFALGAGDAEDELAQVEARLAAERATLIALSADKTQVLSLLDTMERFAHASSQRVAALERRVTRFNKLAAIAKAEVAQTEVVLHERQQQLSPGLFTLYRMHRQQGLSQLLAAQDLASFLKQQRALTQLLEGEVLALRDIEMLHAWQRRRVKRLERWEMVQRSTLQAFHSERAALELRRAEFQQLLESIAAEQSRMQRLVKELEQNEKELTRTIAELGDRNETSEFRARRGQMPYPAAGLVEVGFGKVINARFKTVTEQKGIDLRAPGGTPVVSVGIGTVAYVGWLKGYGNLVIVDHGAGYHSLYAHLADAAVEVGNAVEEGETIGQVGDTGSLKGNYLYFEIRKGGEAIDPLPWLKP